MAKLCAFSPRKLGMNTYNDGDHDGCVLPTIATRDAYTADNGDGDDTIYGLR